MMKTLEKIAARNKDAWNQPVVSVACLGDSVTHGCFEVFMNRFGQIDTRYRPDRGYAAQLRRRLDALYPAAAVSVLNAGVSGGNAGHGLARLERDVLSHRPDLVIVNFALNDSCGGLEKLEDYRRAMAAIFDGVLASGAECMLLTPNRMCAYVAPSVKDAALVRAAEDCSKVQNSGVLDAYVDAARALARERKIPVADAYAEWNRLEAAGVDTTALLANDINHPTEDMHGVFVEKIMDALLRGEG